METLKTEKKLIMDAIKMSAYQVETELLGMLHPHYAALTTKVDVAFGRVRHHPPDWKWETVNSVPDGARTHKNAE